MFRARHTCLDDFEYISTLFVQTFAEIFLAIAGQEYKLIVKRFIGKAPPFKGVIRKKKASFLKRLFKNEEAIA